SKAFAVETFGPWCKDAKDLVSDLGHRLLSITGDPRCVNFLRQRIGILQSNRLFTKKVGTELIARLLQNRLYSNTNKKTLKHRNDYDSLVMFTLGDKTSTPGSQNTFPVCLATGLKSSSKTNFQCFCLESRFRVRLSAYSSATDYVTIQDVAHNGKNGLEYFDIRNADYGKQWGFIVAKSKLEEEEEEEVEEEVQSVCYEGGFTSERCGVRFEVEEWRTGRQRKRSGISECPFRPLLQSLPALLSFSRHLVHGGVTPYYAKIDTANHGLAALPSSNGKSDRYAYSD
ncbi:hypothetical protein C0J52_14390, partial [Blattella germanica]